MTIYALSDIHGYYSIYEKVKKLIQPHDIVFCLGDVCDRGPRSWDTVTAIYNDPQFIYLKGNHEDMLVDFMNSYYKNDDMDADYRINYEYCVMNGGKETIASWINLPEEEKLK